MRKKILLSAYSCRPGFGSEGGVGWKWANLLAKNNEVYVLTRLKNKKFIEDYIRKNNLDISINFIYFDLPKWARIWKRGERGLYLYYTLWQIGGLFKILKIYKKIKFDIVHYLTFGNILLPNFIFFIPSKYVIGPMGGGEKIPNCFLSELSFKGKIKETIKRFVQNVQKINPIFWLNLYFADKILVRTKETYELIPSIFRKKTEIMLETGIPEELLQYSLKKTKNEKYIKIITVGRLIPTKINLFTLKVILNFKIRYKLPFKFYIVGDGPEKNKLLKFVRENNLEKEVIFTGWLSKNEVFDLLSNSDIYFSTTLKEGGSWAFFEAILVGLPVVCLKVNGPDMIVPDDGGIKIEPDSTDKIIEQMSESLYNLCINPDLRYRLNVNARKYLLHNMTWNNILNRIEKIYDEI